MSYSNIISEALRIIKDSAATRWTEDEIRGYIDQGQRMFSTNSLSLEGVQDYIGDSSLDNEYPLPDDFLEFISFIVPKGSNAPLVSTKTLVENNTYKFLTAYTGNEINSICLDFGSWNKMRFYPNPEHNLIVGTLRYKRLARAKHIEIEDEEPLNFFALSRMYLKEKTKEGFKRSTFFYNKFLKISRSLKNNRIDNFKSKTSGSFF